MYKKCIFYFIATGSVYLLTANNFIIKKAKRVVVPYKDQCLEALGDYLKKCPAVISEIGLLLKKYGNVQNTLTTVVTAEFDGKQHELSQCSDKRYKKICDMTYKINERVYELQKTIMQLHSELGQYAVLLHDNQNSKKNKKRV